ncbi:hypothetical protein RRG08_027514 [Elysia crispata]|uniref:Uncharacterized protein n=1 Tax=Elysia crispata TaxID=231223 RepID=A0AAE0YRD5_9GAST|nr:hypothetical protein RRG08_027514 [Elysia crispata]
MRGGSALMDPSSYCRPSTLSGHSSDEVQEKEDSGDESMEDVDDFFWRPPPPDVPPRDDARVLLQSGGEGCRCFPPRSDLGIPSMVYDQITCPHNNSVIGHMHGAVYRFDENWDNHRARIRRPRRPNRHRSRFCIVWGYPSGERSQGQAEFEGGLRGEFRRPSEARSHHTPSQAGGSGAGTRGDSGQWGSREARSVISAQPSPAAGGVGSKPGTTQSAKPGVEALAASQSRENGQKEPTLIQPEQTAPKLSRGKMEKPELKNINEAVPARGSRATILADRLLPRIGYTPERKTREQVTPTPGNRSERGVETPLELPPIASSTPGSMYSRSSMISSSQEFGVRPDINRERNFKGRYYDPATNKTYTYDIRPNFGQRMDQWNAVRN